MIDYECNTKFSDAVEQLNKDLRFQRTETGRAILAEIAVLPSRDYRPFITEILACTDIHNVVRNRICSLFAHSKAYFAQCTRKTTKYIESIPGMCLQLPAKEDM